MTSARVFNHYCLAIKPPALSRVLLFFFLLRYLFIDWFSMSGGFHAQALFQNLETVYVRNWKTCYIQGYRCSSNFSPCLLWRMKATTWMSWCLSSINNSPVASIGTVWFNMGSFENRFSSRDHSEFWDFRPHCHIFHRQITWLIMRCSPCG